MFLPSHSNILFQNANIHNVVFHIYSIVIQFLFYSIIVYYKVLNISSIPSNQKELHVVESICCQGLHVIGHRAEAEQIRKLPCL